MFCKLFMLLLCIAPPILVNVSPDVVVRNEGDDVDMFCEARATPAATLTWLKDGRELASFGHVAVAGNHVVLRGVERSDAGVYSCAFKNVAGTVSHLIKLVIQGMFTRPLSTPFLLVLRDMHYITFYLTFICLVMCVCA